jgi:hypothetical protein
MRSCSIRGHATKEVCDSGTQSILESAFTWEMPRAPIHDCQDTGEEPDEISLLRHQKHRSNIEHDLRKNQILQTAKIHRRSLRSFPLEHCPRTRTLPVKLSDTLRTYGLVAGDIFTAVRLDHRRKILVSIFFLHNNIVCICLCSVVSRCWSLSPFCVMNLV